MTTGVFAMVLAAALLHAAWNALVKINADRLVMIAIMMMSQVAAALLVVPFVAPPTPESWPFIAASTVLNTAYCVFLIKAYSHGDLSHVYPLSRGSAPLIVAAISVFIIGETLTRQAGLSVVVIALGIMSLALTRGAAGFTQPTAIFYALGTGIFIAGYTIVDGMGARLAESAHSYTFWVHLFNGIPIALLALYLRRGQVLRSVRKAWKVGVLGGMISLLAYWIVIWAMTLAPMALVSAVRETSMVFAVLIGVLLLKERLDLARLASIGMTLIGTVMLKMSR
ncbi:MAG: EamA family transporter [Roseitalea sp.]|jgi:drug/metabolite transporter (DMT)-like permease|nr:EamA family transporter [Roseitalea sp.]MBO6722284.1 EamA family transporter [Roseitalea sp.]MBO6742386.1 EamA family transporter [Roseitalea sp.]